MPSFRGARPYVTALVFSTRCAGWSLGKLTRRLDRMLLHWFSALDVLAESWEAHRRARPYVTALVFSTRCAGWSLGKLTGWLDRMLLH